MATPRRVLLHLVACVAIAMGAALSEVWGLGPCQRRGARRVEIQLDIDRIEAQIRILSAWFRRSKRRPRYCRSEWLLILEYAERWRLSAAQIAREFLVSPATAYRRSKCRREGQLGTLDCLPAKLVPPCRRICDSRRQFVVEMAVRRVNYSCRSYCLRTESYPRFETGIAPDGEEKPCLHRSASPLPARCARRGGGPA